MAQEPQVADLWVSCSNQQKPGKWFVSDWQQMSFKARRFQRYKLSLDWKRTPFHGVLWNAVRPRRAPLRVRAPRGPQQLFPSQLKVIFCDKKITSDMKKKLFKNTWSRAENVSRTRGQENVDRARGLSGRVDHFSLMIKSPAATHTCKGSHRRKLDFSAAVSYKWKCARLVCL